MSGESYLDAVAEVYAIADYYAREGDPELRRRVESRIERDGMVTVGQVKSRMQELADKLVENKPGPREEPRGRLLRYLRRRGDWFVWLIRPDATLPIRWWS